MDGLPGGRLRPALHFTASDDRGSFTLPMQCAGSYTLSAEHESLGERKTEVAATGGITAMLTHVESVGAERVSDVNANCGDATHSPEAQNTEGCCSILDELGGSK